MSIDADLDLADLSLAKENLKQYTVSISPSLHDRLEKHILIVKKLCRPGQTKQNWLMEAIHDKLEREKFADVPKESRINLRIDTLTLKKIFERVTQIKQFRYTYSKKQWILEAVEEKLEKEKQMTESKLAEYRASLKN